MDIGPERRYDALVLAGSTNDEPLRRFSESRSKAAVRLYGRLMIEYVLEALLSATSVSSVTVAGAPELASLPSDLRRSVQWVKSGSTMSSSLMRGLSAIDSHGQVLVVACDIPLITSETIDRFVRSARQARADVVYPIVWRRVIQRAFPGMLKTYLRLRDGVFTAGNICLMPGRLSAQHRRLLRQATKWRDYPGVLFAILGWRGFARFTLRRMTLPQLEDVVSRRLRVRVKAVPCDDVGIGFDIDRPHEYVAALRTIGSHIGRLMKPTNLEATYDYDSLLHLNVKIRR